MICFNKPPLLGTELTYISEIINANAKLCGGGSYSKRCEAWLEQPATVRKVLLTPSCTAALEMAALLINIQPGDEVIMPSYTFVSTANAFVLRGAKIVFVDIRPDTMNIDEQKIEAAITEKTRAIVPVHYAGIACEMDSIMALAHRYNLYVIEDAAQGVMATYNEKPLGSIGHLGCYSFHETKNYTSGGEGGALLINDERFVERAEVIREKGTNRSQFLKGQIDKYTWRDIGSSFLPSELQAAYLLAQLEAAEQINEKRLALWHQYHEAFASIKEEELIGRPHAPSACKHNAHMYYLKLNTLAKRDAFINKMQAYNIQTPFHYVPLHSSPAGLKYGRFSGKDEYTTVESEKLVRLPLWYNLSHTDAEVVIYRAITCLKEL
ncbi:dTDP-4-amino-4,6-dideoxygalactose transaminase [Legionella clemsonensis]|uniref:dTDP-4-amino-4,6-dideoxygalactose transaminase n=1 Tax=Legionella clemsonensis TaxID=1867846 RepID=A0A222P3M5_9GAMM|nr:dTDP-4-amino-4,6-dideoxygalactose transaminase [Legionella clemsonensis]ASQ46454.1 dTDP-4-amino-4,6-dideoxygalactose transaminase [Legionella clemsonensis]